MFCNRDKAKQFIRCLLDTEGGSNMVQGDGSTKIDSTGSLPLKHTKEQGKEKKIK